MAKLLSAIQPLSLADAQALNSPEGSYHLPILSILSRFIAYWKSVRRNGLSILINSFGIILVFLFIIPLTSRYNTMVGFLDDVKRVNASQYFDILFDTILLENNAVKQEESRTKLVTNVKSLREIDGLIVNSTIDIRPVIGQNGSPQWCVLLFRFYGYECGVDPISRFNAVAQQIQVISATITNKSNSITQTTEATPAVSVDDITLPLPRSLKSSTESQCPSNNDESECNVSRVATSFGLTTTKFGDLQTFYLLRAQTEEISSALGSSFLPLLYGFLGSSVYLMRKFFSDGTSGRGEEFTLGQVFLRLGLGGVAGLAIGWFWSPAATKNVAEATVFSTLPFGMAFLAGFSIELLFSILDRIIEAIDPNGKRPAQ